MIKVIKKAKWWKLVPFAGDHTATTLFGRIYVPEKLYPLSENDPLYIHELTHIRQQEKYGPLFYVKYTLSKDFRLEVEAEAYANQVKARNPANEGERLSMIETYARILSKGTYGNISYQEAVERISKYIETV